MRPHAAVEEVWQARVSESHGGFAMSDGHAGSGDEGGDGEDTAGGTEGGAVPDCKDARTAARLLR
jgi:hypothetical protein